MNPSINTVIKIIKAILKATAISKNQSYYHLVLKHTNATIWKWIKEMEISLPFSGYVLFLSEKILVQKEKVQGEIRINFKLPRILNVVEKRKYLHKLLKY